MFIFRDKYIPLNKEIVSSLQAIWSIGWNKATLISTKLGLAYPFFINNLNSYRFSLVFFLLKNLTLSEVRLKRTVRNNIQHLSDISSYAGARHFMNLPVRGQRTRTNAGTPRRLSVSKNNAD